MTEPYEDEAGLSRFSPEQIKTMWDACTPKAIGSHENIGDIYITGTDGISGKPSKSSSHFRILDFSKKNKDE